MQIVRHYDIVADEKPELGVGLTGWVWYNDVRHDTPPDGIQSGSRSIRRQEMKQSQITYWCHEIIRSQAKKGGFYIDATMGNGNDTRILCELAGEEGTVLAFDIQRKALQATKELLQNCGYMERAHLIQDGHEHMDRYAEAESADIICFNFGYLPGGDHDIATKADTSLTAISKGLDILKSGGMMSLCIYSGGDTGFEEKERILEYLKELSPKEYTVIIHEYYNRRNNPPMPVFIFKK